MKIGFTNGAYDLFHIGHLNILKNAKEHCDYLIVGVNTDELIKSYKNKTPVIPFEERAEIVRSIEYVDEVVPRTEIDKIKFAIDNKVDVLFVGDDWKGHQRWIDTEAELAKHGIKVMYLPYTRHISTTELIARIKNWVPNVVAPSNATPTTPVFAGYQS